MPPQEYEAGQLSDLADGTMRQVDVGGRDILLIRSGDDVRAIDALCPHAGAPLIEGVRHRDRLVCPWHKATFCTRTGALLEPPAVDGLTRYDARIDGQRVLVTIPDDVPPAAKRHGHDARCFVIVGAGGAGAMAAQSLREEGFGGRVVMLDRINRVPYDRTLLSKYALSGEPGAEKSPLQTQAYYKDHAIERMTADVTRVDASGRRIHCADGSSLSYDKALVATGGSPIWPDLPGIELGNVFRLRSRHDADAILAQAERSERAVVLGASFIGLEVAASLRERGLDVTVVGKESVPLEKQLGPRVGGVFVALHKDHGVQFRLGATIERLEGDGAVSRVMLKGGEALPADLVVVGFGIQPETGFLDGVRMHDDGSVLVDPTLQAADNLFVAGDIARFPQQVDGTAIRVEHWRVALQQGRLAAQNMLGQRKPFDAVPAFWTIQYMKRLDYVGHASEWDDVVVHGDLCKPEFLAYYIKGGIVHAAAGMGRDTGTAALGELMHLRRDWTAAELSDTPESVLANIGR